MAVATSDLAAVTLMEFYFFITYGLQNHRTNLDRAPQIYNSATKRFNTATGKLFGPPLDDTIAGMLSGFRVSMGRVQSLEGPCQVWVRKYDGRGEKSQCDLSTVQGELESWMQLGQSTEEKYHKWFEVVDKTKTWMLDGVKEAGRYPLPSNDDLKLPVLETILVV